MKTALQKFGKFYSNIILNFIGIFIFTGILAVVFGDYGWFPNENIYAISQFVYQCVIPVMIAYATGNELAKFHAGGEIAVMATAGMILTNEGVGIFGAMVLGPLSALLWKKVLSPILTKVKTGMEMLVRNLLVAFAGSILAIFSFYFVAPALSVVIKEIFVGIDYLMSHNLLFLLSILIEPGKVLFLNNSINHGILIPLGLQQVSSSGNSIFFLLEANPGPGLGVLFALYLMKKEKRKEYTTSMFAEFIGGIHEVYFPEVLANMWLFLAVIAGGAVGNLCFSLGNAAAVAPVSPGSIISIFMVTQKGALLTVLIGVFASVSTSMGVSILILKMKKEKKEDVVEKIENRIETPVRQVGVICDAGVGSSAMGAALFRRKLKEMNVQGVDVKAYARDQIPPDLDLAVCQRDFQKMKSFEMTENRLHVVDSLMNQEEYLKIIEEIKRRNGETI